MKSQDVARLKFRSDEISGVVHNPGDIVRTTIQSLSQGGPIILGQGYGAYHSVPFRVLAYVVPVLRLARQLPRSHTVVELYTATAGVLRANPHIDSFRIIHSSAVIRFALLEYIDAFHPDLASRVSVLDEPPSREVNAKDAIEYLAPHARGVARSDQAIARFIEHRGGEAALRYMIEHALYMRDPIMGPGGKRLPLLIPGMLQPRGGENIVMVGGPAEKVFYKMRQGLAERAGIHGLWRSHQFFTPVGNPPTYHPQAGEPLWNLGGGDDGSIVDCAKFLDRVRSAGSGPFRDWVVLLQDAAGVERFTIQGKIFTPQEWSVLRRGFANLMDWRLSFGFASH